MNLSETKCNYFALQLRKSMILDPKGSKTFEAYVKTKDDVSKSCFFYIVFNKHAQ